MPLYIPFVVAHGAILHGIQIKKFNVEDRSVGPKHPILIMSFPFWNFRHEKIMVVYEISMELREADSRFEYIFRLRLM